MKMKIKAISVGRPRLVMWKGEPVSTGIFKEQVEGKIMLRTLNLDGDRQGDLTVHGGPTKAVYAYPAEHYEFWKKELPDMELPCGMFGENFTTEGLLETEVNIGERFRIGGAEVVVTEPRVPCYKLGIRFGRADILKRFLVSRRSGFYFGVLREGEVQAGDTVERLSHDEKSVSIADIIRLYAFERDDLETLRRAVQLETLPETWRGYFRRQLQRYD
jgi:MOSC domain-containing protein YiiM